MKRPIAIGVDLGATKIAAVLVRRDGRILAEHQAPTLKSDPALVLDQIASLINQLLAAAPYPVDGIGIGSPGLVNSETGVVRAAINLKWDSVSLRDEIYSRIPSSIPIWIQKDTNASALGEYYYGIAQGCQDFIFLSIGSGLGVGVMASGCLVVGSDWAAADLGHLSLDTRGAVCTCGQRGCAETIVSGPGLVSLVKRMLSENLYPTQMSEGSPVSAEGTLKAASNGDLLGRAAFAQVGCQLGIVLANCVALLNPRRAVIGGGLGLAAFDFLAPAAWEELRQRVLPENLGSLEIVPSGQLSSAVGAASLVWYFQKVGRRSRRR